MIIVSCLMAHVLPCLPDALEQRLMNVKFVFFSETNVLCDTRGTNSFFMWTAKLAAKLLAALATRFTAPPISRKPPSLHVEYLSFKVDSPTNS